MDRLAKSSSEQIAIRDSLWKKSLAQKLDLAAKASSYELGPGESRLWQQVLAGCTEEEVSYGFLNYFRSGSTFMPRPGQIRELVILWRADNRRLSEYQKTQDMLKENREARATGKAVGMAEMIEEWKKVMKKTRSMEGQRAEAPTAQGLAPGQDPQGSQTRAVPPLTDSKDLES